MKQKKSFLSILLLSLSLFFFNAEYSHASVISEPDNVKQEITKNFNNFNKTFTVAVKYKKDYKTINKDLQSLVKSIEKDYKDTYYLLEKYNYSINCSGGDKTCKATFKVTYTSDGGDYKEYKNYVKQIAKDKKNLSYDEKIEFANKFITDKAEYDYTYFTKSKYSEHSPVKIYKEGLGVCQAYAIFAYDLLTELGVKNYLLAGYQNNIGHLWNVLKDSKGNVVHLDTTWNDNSYSKKDYYMVGTKFISETHIFTHDDLDAIAKLLGGKVDMELKLEKDRKPATTKNPVVTGKSQASYAKEFVNSIGKSVTVGDMGKLPIMDGFTLTLQEDVHKYDSYKSEVFVTDSSGNLVSVKVKVEGKEVTLSEAKGKFKSGSTYYLVVLPNVESETSIGKHIKEGTYVKFTAK